MFSSECCAAHHRRSAFGTCEAGVYHGDVDARGPELIDEVLGERGDGDIADAADRVTALASRQAAELHGGTRKRGADLCDIHALQSQSLCDSISDTAAAAGDKRAFAFELQVHGVSPVSWVSRPIRRRSPARPHVRRWRPERIRPLPGRTRSRHPGPPGSWACNPAWRTTR